MVTKRLQQAGYTPAPPPANAKDLPRYLSDEFNRIAAALAVVAEGNYTPTYAYPPKPYPGMVRYFDGVLCNPGGGEGWYGYTATGTWIKLG